jgi:hypothetical protein
MFGEEAVCPDGLFVPAVFRESDFYLNSLIWPSIRATNKKNEYTNKKGVILYVYPCIGPKKSPFRQNKYTKDGCKGKKPSHRRKTTFVYLCICVSGCPKLEASKDYLN